MKSNLFILILCVFAPFLYKPAYTQSVNGSKLIKLSYFGDTIQFYLPPSAVIPFADKLSQESVKEFYAALDAGNYQPIIDSLVAYKQTHELNDWLYYQLIRKTAQQIALKADNYFRYTLYKWFLLSKSGYNATLGIGTNELLLYVYSKDNIYDVPYYTSNGLQHICLNIHDYKKTTLLKDTIYPVNITVPGAVLPFSYKVTRLPNFTLYEYVEKKLQFDFRNRTYHFKIKTNPQVKNIFLNYPVVDFADYFNIPMSKETYQSLLPELKKTLKSMRIKKGIDYLMNFTRYTFLYEDDKQNFGKEKRLSPEETLLYDYSDCDDRAALFFYLVKEIYNRPMIALLYPSHVTIAVQFRYPIGKPLIYNGNKYSVCEPTPQAVDRGIGQIAPELSNIPYQVVYSYFPDKKQQ